MTDTVIMPDDKDWTWVVGRACPECGADVSSIPAESVAQEIRDNADAWEEILRRDPGELRRRLRPDRWSALEYAAHVRDVYVLYRERLRLMMECDDPLYPNWDQDAASKSYRAGSPERPPISSKPRELQRPSGLWLRASQARASATAFSVCSDPPPRSTSSLRTASSRCG